MKEAWYRHAIEYNRTTQMYLEGIMLSEIRLRKTHAGWYHLYVDSKKAELVITRGWGGGGSRTEEISNRTNSQLKGE